MFESVILAGGKGTRLKSVTKDLPKPMVEINGQPFLYLLMKRLEEQGCKHIVLSLGYRASYIIESVLKDNPVSCPVDFSVEKDPMGTGGAIKMASQHIASEKFIVLNGDTFTQIDYMELLGFSTGCDLVISSVCVSDAKRYGTLNVDEQSNVLSMNEKGSSGASIINSGVYVVSKEKISNYPRDNFSFEKDYTQNFNGKIKTYTCSEYFIDIGIPEDYYKACDEL